MNAKKLFIVTLILAGLVALQISCEEMCGKKPSQAMKQQAPCEVSTIFYPYCGKSTPEVQKAAMPCIRPGEKSSFAQSYPVSTYGGNVICLEKTAPKEVMVNEPFDYQIKVTNLTDRQLRNVIVSDKIAHNLTLKSSTPDMERTGDGTVRWMVGTLEPRASRTINVNAVAGSRGDITSCAQVSYDFATCSTIRALESQLKLAKFAPSEVLKCDRIPVRYVVTNSGDGAACDIKIEDNLSQGLMTSDGKNTVMFELATLGPGQSKEFQTMVDASGNGRYASRAMAKARIGGSAESGVAETVVKQPMLAVDESGPTDIYVGRSMTYEITVTNRGDGVARDTIIEASVPDEIRFENATLDGRFTHLSPGKVTWNLGVLEPNASKKVTMTLTGEQIGTVKTTILAKAYCSETASASAETLVAGAPGIHLDVIDLIDPLEVSNNEVYTIKAVNQGPTTITNVRISCMLEDNMQYVSSTGPTTATVAGNGITFAPLATIASKGSVEWQVTVKAVREGDVRFKVTMNSDQLGNRPVEDVESTTFYK